MQISRFRRAATAALAGGLVVGLIAATPTVSVAVEAAAQSSAQSAAPTPQPLDIVVLGDSYSAGNGATNEAGEAETYGPTGCLRSKVGWAEKYAAALRAKGAVVNVANHACSGGKAPDILAPRAMDTASASTPTPEGVTTIAEANAYLAQKDFCNTKMFPDEEFWTYQATSVDASTIDYDCTRTLRPQADFITPQTDLVVFTMGGNDAGFTTIVTQCFVLKMGSGCQAAIEAARAKLPEIKQLLVKDIDGIRAAGLRDDAKIVQLGYPYLQTDNDYMALGVPPYAAGDAIRSLIDDGTTALASVATEANAGHPGQMTFVPGIKEAFAGHEPDATTPAGNPDRWINQVGDGSNTSLWYHPNGLGQSAYAAVLLRGGDYGATPTGSDTPPATVRTTLRARAVDRTVTAGDVVEIRTTVRRSDGSRPSGTVLIRLQDKNAADRARVSTTGVNVLRFAGLPVGRHRIKAVFANRTERLSVVTTVVVRRR